MHHYLTGCLVVGVCALAAVGAGAQDDATARGRELLATLRPGHPRLILTDDGLARLKETIKADATAADWAAKLHDRAVSLLDAPTCEHKLVGPRLLSQSRACLDRVYTLALMYRLEGDRRFADRATKEMLAAAAFPDWNPSHFLDTAEMTHALAVGYDWLYDALSPNERATIRAALVDRGLGVGRNAYAAATPAWWSRCNHNWNQVCNGGLGIGALALADEEPNLCAFILGNAAELVKIAMKEYEPDGGWAEGPGYWHYATRYTVYFLASLETALGTDAGLCDGPGFANTGAFRMHFVSPIGQAFNYADAGAGSGSAEEMLWLARKFGRPEYAWFERSCVRTPHPLNLVWYSAEGSDPATSGVPLDACYMGIDVAFTRSSWTDPDAIFVGFKGGDNQANHSHLDLGTFVLDALGVRWAVDLGADNYDLPGYFGRQRWDYYRLRTESHNTLVLNGANQDPKARAPIVARSSSPEWAGAVADLSAAYGASATSVRRGIALIDRSVVLVQDEVSAPASTNVEWGMMTEAEADLQGSIAVLTRGDAHLLARIVEPADAEFVLIPADAPAPQAQQPSAHKLAIRLTTSDEPQRIAVTLIPYRGEPPITAGSTVVPLVRWPGQL